MKKRAVSSGAVLKPGLELGRFRKLRTKSEAPTSTIIATATWMTFLESRVQEALTLRVIEAWEYHEIAAAKAIPIGTVQGRVFNAKRYSPRI